MATPYQILNVHPRATHEQIRVAYLDQACQNHPSKQVPDQHPAIQQARFRRAAEAYTLIGNDSRRKLSDLALAITEKGQVPSSSLVVQQSSRARHRSSSEATGADAHSIRDRLPPGLRALILELDPIKVFNRVLVELDRERQLASTEERLSQSCDRELDEGHRYQSSARRPVSPERHRTSLENYKASYEQQRTSPENHRSLHEQHHPRPNSILSGSSCGRPSPRSSTCSSSRRRVSFTDQTILTDELKQIRQAFSDQSLYDDHDQSLSTSAPSQTYLSLPCQRNTEDEYPWSSLTFDDPRELGRAEGDLANLCAFLNELDRHGSFDERMARALYEGGVRRKETLLAMSREEVIIFLNKLRDRLTTFQEATLPARLERWKAENRILLN
ncbi:hypothetical protein CROQUDRAFT_129890 [Cronartium quercuum f. sp. fusiforme G11]|uniref:J domain-containing protein n=1 Tax=Cronartium quercuum f. sp. fusiforme G11 TaxID=708437 RepID=A0A9P6NYL4_9BASI|nr:hypothetical protein CROQUDRAFT_129890 [Cronartium quercuum f. sp. fusiforme G11]